MSYLGNSGEIIAISVSRTPDMRKACALEWSDRDSFPLIDFFLTKIKLIHYNLFQENLDLTYKEPIKSKVVTGVESVADKANLQSETKRVFKSLE